MHSLPSLLLALPLALAVPLEVVVQERQTGSGYAPQNATCPSGSLVRAATSLSSSETSYTTKRKAKANTALAAFLKKTNSKFSTSSLPTVGLTVSGGGYRSLLEGAGVIQSFDSRDSTANVSGIYQSLTYQAGLSGGGWLTSSIIGNNYPTITSLKTGLWETAFADSLLIPDNLLVAAAYTEVIADVAAKNAAGFAPTLTDPYGRLLSYQLLLGNDGGVADRLSAVTSLSNFTSFNAPYPIITSLGVNTFQGKCLPDDNATQYEFHPYEFGSWDKGVSAFTQTAYLGTTLSNGKPTGKCIENYDNLGYILGTSSNLFNELCGVIDASNSTDDLSEDLEGMLTLATGGTPATRDLYAVYKNPFANYSRSSLVSNQTELDLVDGGEADQNNPIWPFIQSSKRVDVLIVNDNSADTDDNFPDGSEIYMTYLQAKNDSLTRMPVIPPSSTFVAKGYNKRATFFGCNTASTLTIIYLPNVNYTYASNQPTAKLEYTKAETDAMIANGNQIGTQNGTADWPTCLGCAIMKKTGTTLPSNCTACFTKYCYN